MRILIVEDEMLTAIGMRMCLGAAGHDIAGIARDPVEALRLAVVTQPDLALVDIELADRTSGLDTAKVLSETGTPCLFVTSDPDQARRHPALAIGCLSKPADAAAVVESVRAVAGLLKGHRLPDRLPRNLEVFDKGEDTPAARRRLKALPILCGLVSGASGLPLLQGGILPFF